MFIQEPNIISNFLKASIRISGPGKNPLRYQRAGKDYQKRNIAAEIEEGEAFRQSAEAVFDQIKGELDNLKRFTPEANIACASLVSSFFATNAKKLGVTPEALWKEYAFTVRNEGGQTHAYLQSAKNSVQSALEKVSADKSYTGTHKLMPVADWAVKAAADHGLDIAGFEHAIDGSAIRHIIKKHGNEKTEANRGQVAITREDFLLIPEIISNPDKTIYGMKNDIGREIIGYIKQMQDGTTVYLEEVRTGRKTLATQSMRKYPPTHRATSIEKSLSLTSKTASEDEISIVENPSGNNQSTFEQKGFTEISQPSAEELAEARRQYNAVVAKYQGTDQWMKAPNGKPTNLTERQWVQVRTENFKAWFGDWEHVPESASKIVDENGEPLVVYHGTNGTNQYSA